MIFAIYIMLEASLFRGNLIYTCFIKFIKMFECIMYQRALISKVRLVLFYSVLKVLPFNGDKSLTSCKHLTLTQVHYILSAWFYLLGQLQVLRESLLEDTNFLSVSS